MAMPAPFRIGNAVIKNPTTFSISRYNVTTMERLSNADMVGDLLAKKHKFFFTYEAITARELNNILEAIWNHNSLFFQLRYPHNDSIGSAMVYVGEIPTELHRAGTNLDNWIWKNVNFNLIQR